MCIFLLYLWGRVRERSIKLRTNRYLVILSLLFFTGCAGNSAVTSPSAEYVEIDNPAFTMSPNAPATIWVPRSYVDSGVPRGGELVKKGYEAAKEKLSASPAQEDKQPAVAVAAPALLPAPVYNVKNRIAVLELGSNGLLLPFNETVKKTAACIMLDPAQAPFLARYAPVTTQAERGTFALRLQEDYGANLVIFVSAPEGIVSGKRLKAEIVDGMGGELVRLIEVAIPRFTATDPAAREAALSSALLKLSGQIREVVVLLPWYGRVVALEGERVYINAGKEADLRSGQLLKVYRGGKVVKGLGFAPGSKVGTIEISGFVGANGAYGILRDGGGVRVSDLVSFE